MLTPKRIIFTSFVMLSFASFFSCNEDDSGTTADCTDVDNIEYLDNRGDCAEILGFSNEVTIAETGDIRIISSNSIPDHMVGLFGMVAGALNPNAIAPVSDSYSVPADPSLANTMTVLLNPNSGPQYELGILLNGVLLDPEAAEPWPHDGIMSSSAKNWEWNLDAMSVNLGLDCNNAHVQPTGKYHYHGSPTLYLEAVDITDDQMTLIGYAADGFPIYYRYAHSEANNNSSSVAEMNTSYQLKTGMRPGDGSAAPCGEYSGIYTNDYEYISGLGDLDECNGRTGVTPEYPGGTYYYMITESFPFLPRCLKGTPSNDFKIG